MINLARLFLEQDKERTDSLIQQLSLLSIEEIERIVDTTQDEEVRFISKMIMERNHG
jgi:hypothetical protein